MAELVDARDLKSLGLGRPGSSPGARTKIQLPSIQISADHEHGSFVFGLGNLLLSDDGFGLRRSHNGSKRFNPAGARRGANLLSTMVKRHPKSAALRMCF